MKFIKNVFRKKSTRLQLSDQDIKEAGACPNCWGVQAYENKYIRFEADRQIDIINHDRSAQKAFVQKFIENYITGIRLKKNGEYLVCPRCDGKSKFVSGKAV